MLITNKPVNKPVRIDVRIGRSCSNVGKHRLAITTSERVRERRRASERGKGGDDDGEEQCVY